MNTYLLIIFITIQGWSIFSIGYIAFLGDGSFAHAIYKHSESLREVPYCLLFVGGYFKKASSISSVHFRFDKVLCIAAVIYVSERCLNANELALQLGEELLMDFSVLLLTRLSRFYVS